MTENEVYPAVLKKLVAVAGLDTENIQGVFTAIWTVMHPLHQQAVFPAMIMTVRPAHGTAVRRQEKLC